MVAAAACCCGFRWGLGKIDSCEEADKTLKTLASVLESLKRAQLDEVIIKGCPDGAPGLFVRALQSERAMQADSALKLYCDAIAKDTIIAEAHGNLGLLELTRERRRCISRTAQALLLKPAPRYHKALAKILGGGSHPALALFHYEEALKHSSCSHGFFN